VACVPEVDMARWAGISFNWFKFCVIDADSTVRRTRALTMEFAHSIFINPLRANAKHHR
jgi:hypothetical protein